MNDLLRLTVGVIGMIFASVNIYLLYKRRVSERLFIFWAVAVVIAFLVAIFPVAFNDLAFSVGVSYPPALLFLIVILGVITVTINQSIQITILRRKMQGSGQLIALMQQEISELRKVAKLDVARRERPNDDLVSQRDRS